MGRRGNDEGSIWKRSDGRWSGSYFVPTATGGRVRRYVYGATRENVQAKLVKLMAQVERGLPVATTQATVGSYLRRWLAEVAAQRVRVGLTRFDGQVGSGGQATSWVIAGVAS
jgi:integrase